jgi:hypothetical protein
LLVGEAAIVLQRAEDFEIEAINGNHASDVHFMHKPCVTLADLRRICMHFAAKVAETGVS